MARGREEEEDSNSEFLIDRCRPLTSRRFFFDGHDSQSRVIFTITYLMHAFTFVVLLIGLAGFSTAKIFLSEDFGSGWEGRWVTSEARDDLGAFAAGCGDYSADDCTGIHTSQDAKFYAVSTALSEEFDTTDKDFVVQVAVAFPQSIDCGGGYLKVLPPGFDPKAFTGDSQYTWMFGPDICGTTNKKVRCPRRSGVLYL